MSAKELYTDVVELCALLQCLGFTVRSLDTSDCNASQDDGLKTVVVNCQSSGIHVVLESPGSCTCPTPSDQNSGFWQVFGVTGGKKMDKGSGSTLLGTLSKEHQDRISKELRLIVQSIKELNEEPQVEPMSRSASALEIASPERIRSQIKAETPTRYRSLDTLTSSKEGELPTPGALSKPKDKDLTSDDRGGDRKDKSATMCKRQSTYTIRSTPDSVRRRNKTSSPLQCPPSNLLDSLIAAEKTAEDLRNKLATVIRDVSEEYPPRDDSSMSSMVLDVSKISVLKESSRSQFASSPNLSILGSIREDPKSKLKIRESSSTSNLRAHAKEGTASKLKRLSPGFFKSKKDQNEKDAKDSKVGKFNSLFKAKVATPVRKPLASPNVSTNSRKFSHVKSTIPRPTTKQE